MAKIILSLKYGKDVDRKASFADFIPFNQVIQWGHDTFGFTVPKNVSVNGYAVIADASKTLSELGLKDGDVVSFDDADVREIKPRELKDGEMLADGEVPKAITSSEPISAPSNPKVVKVNKGK